MQHILHFITNERLADLHTALNRAANTWEDAPAWVIDLCDALHAGQVGAGLSVTLDESTAFIGTLCAKAVRGEVPGGNLPDWPEDLTTYELRAAYQRGVADGRIGYVKPDPTGSFKAFESKRDELLDIKNAPRRGQWEPYPHQQEVMASLVSVPTKITMADELDDIVDPSFDYLPEWAERKVAPGEDGYLCVHAQLMTRDGRRSGNAVIRRVLGGNFTVLTDMGNEMTMNHMELEEYFYPPVYIMKDDCVGKRLAKSEPAAEDSTGYAEQFDAAVQHYVKLFGITDWDISVSQDSFTVEGPQAKAFMYPVDRHADLVWNSDAVHLPPGTTPRSVGLHEVLHVLLASMVEPDHKASNAEQAAEHGVINRLVRAILQIESAEAKS